MIGERGGGGIRVCFVGVNLHNQSEKIGKIATLLYLVPDSSKLK
jgi:hypothetical protein